MTKFYVNGTLFLGVAVSLATVLHAAGQKDSPKNERPSLSLRVTPQTVIAPARVTGSAELRGGSSNFEEYYCVTVEWEWDDGTISQSTTDCDPYEPGKSEIRRRYTSTHAYERAGAYKVSFRLKKKDKTLAMATAVVQVTGGDPFLY
jgi:hypothetical protein